MKRSVTDSLREKEAAAALEKKKQEDQKKNICKSYPIKKNSFVSAVNRDEAVLKS